MRKLNFNIFCLFAIIFLMVAQMASAGDGEWTSNATRSGSTVYGDVIRFTCTVDSVDTLTSASFTLGKYDNAYWGTPRDTVGNLDSTLAANLGKPFRLQYTATSVLAAPKLTGYVQGSFDGTNWDAVDTLFTDFVSESRTVANYDLNNRKYPFYRVVIYGVALNRSDTVFDMYWWCYTEEY